MSIKTIDGILLRKMIIAGSNALERNKQMIDALNVFPVPDGDTGTNMSMTLLVAAREVEKTNTPNASDVMKAMSGGSLRGARGNSGVIVSQLVRGFAKGVEGQGIITGEVMSRAFTCAADTAYKAVMKPKEGTILTVARAIAQKYEECAAESNELGLIFTEVMRYANIILDRTTSMLPELKQAGVVDAGGKGLLLFLEAAVKATHLPQEAVLESGAANEPVQLSPAAKSLAEIKYGYCTEFFINLRQSAEFSMVEGSLKKYLEGMGDSVVVVGDEDIIKVHVHTNHPGAVLEYAIRQGSLENIKIDNMRSQHNNLINFNKEEAPRKDVGFVAVAAGAGMAEIMTTLGVDQVIEGGQTMNPSTEDILAAIARVNANEVFVLPNNKNIILAVQQAQELSANTNVHLIPTKTIPQGITALVSYMPDISPDENEATMREVINGVKTGQVTYAVRNTVIDGIEIKEGDVLCMLESKIIHVANSVQSGAKYLFDMMMAGGGEIASIYYGEDVKEEQADELVAYVMQKWPDCDMGMQYGAQPLYHYILSVE